MIKRLIIFLMLIAFSATSVYADHYSSMELYKKAWDAYTKRDFKECESLLKKALMDDPNNNHARSLLAEVLYLNQNMDAAAKEYDKLAEDDQRNIRYKTRKEQIGIEREIEKPFTRKETGIFQVFFLEEAEPFDISGIMADLEAAYTYIGKDLKRSPKGHITVLFYPGEEFYRIRHLPKEVLGLFDGKVRLPVPDQGESASSIKHILWHEYTHALIYEITGGECPLWLNEGIAQYEQSHVKPIDTSLFMQNVKKGSILSLDDLFKFAGTSPEPMKVSAGIFYQQSYMMVRFIEEQWGKKKLLDILKAASRRKDMYKIFVSHLHVGKSEFQKLWDRYLIDRLSFR